MLRFGESSILRNNSNFVGRTMFFFFGITDIGHFLRSQYFKKILRVRSLRKLLKGAKDLRILDIGCGSGDYSFYLAQRYPYSSIDALDINGDVLRENKLIQEKLKISNINFQKSDALKLRENEKYNFVISICLIIYMSYAENKEILINIYNSLKKNGIMYLYLPHKNWKDSIMINPKFYKNMYKQVLTQSEGGLYDENELPDLLRKIGFNVIKQKITGGFWGGLAWEIDQVLKEYNLNVIKMVLLPFLKTFCLLDMIINYKGTGMIFIAQKI